MWALSQRPLYPLSRSSESRPGRVSSLIASHPCLNKPMVRLSFSRGLLALCLSASTFLIVLLGTASLHSSVASAHVDKKRQGAEIFATSGCTHCHGANGEGTEMGPSLRDLRKHLKPEQIHRQIVDGGKQMPAFGDSLGKTQVDDLVAFLRAKTWIPVPQPPPAQPKPATAAPQP